MTGFGRASISLDAFSAAIEISSVNGKKADFYISCAKEFSFCENHVRTHLQRHFERGKITVKILADHNTGSVSTLFHAGKIREGLDALASLSKANNVPFSPTTSDILALARLLKEEQSGVDQEKALPHIIDALQQALAEHDAMRREEGDALKKDLEQQLKKMMEATKQISVLSQEEPGDYRTRLQTRLAEAGLELELEDERVLKEIALFADRCDVSEELTRLDSHFSQFTSFLEKAEAVGRRLDFLCQEMHRECNTIGSKTKNIEVTKLVIENKATLEAIREQVQNVE